MKLDAKPNRRARGQSSLPLCENRYTLLIFDELATLPELIRKSSEFLCVLLAFDAQAIGSDTLKQVSGRLLSMGVVYLCAWGTDCERVHDCFDSQRSRSETDSNVIMTTWHADEEVEEAAHYFVWNSIPAEDYEGKCEWIALSQGGAPWNDRLRRELEELVRKATDKSLIITDRSGYYPLNH